MCLTNTFGHISGRTALWFAIFVFAGTASAQDVHADWRRVGNSAMDLSLASVATGPVDRVWFSEDGARLYARAADGKVYTTEDFETWTAAPDPVVVPPVTDFTALRKPEPGASVRAKGPADGKMYAIGRFAYRSDDGGVTWSNVTGYRDGSVIGDGLADVAASPRNSDEIVIAGAAGVWRSVDGGLSWTGLNSGLPNLPVRRVLATALNTRGVRIEVDIPAGPAEFEWAPGEKDSWRSTDDVELRQQQELERTLSSSLHAAITAAAQSGDYIYAGSSEGQLWASNDRGKTWRANPDPSAAPVEAIFVDSREPRLAVAALGPRLAGAPPGARTRTSFAPLMAASSGTISLRICPKAVFGALRRTALPARFTSERIAGCT